MRRTMILLVLVSLLVFGLTVPAFANGASGDAQLHPGHQGYLSSGGANVGAAPVFHFKAHGGPGYAPGPGGWGSAVSATAKACKGIPNAHSGC